MFPEPLFDGRFACCSSGWWGAPSESDGRTGRRRLLDGIAFNVDTSCWPDNGVREVNIAYKLDVNEFAATAACS
jgi:single-stranded-DNA-specific exonuclease